MSDHKLQVGQQLWFASTNRWNPCRFVTVKKVGHKWADIGGSGRVDIETLIVEGGAYNSPGRCYIAKEEHDAKLRLNKEWDALWMYFRTQHAPPSGITLAQVTEAQRALGIAPTARESDDAE